MYSGNQPIIILQKNTVRERGEEALIDNINAAKAIADSIRSTLGPKGMDKMMVDDKGDVIITNDGATILKDLDIVHPAAKMMVEVAETQDEVCGDGTTSAVVLAGELLKRSEDMIGRIHTSTITRGYRMATDKVIEYLDEMKYQFSEKDKKMLKNIAKTALTGKSMEANKEILEDIAVESVLSITDEEKGKIHIDLDNIKMIKKAGGSMSDTAMVDGLVIEKERALESMPSKVDKPKVAVLSSPLKQKKTGVKASIGIKDPKQIEKFLAQEETTIRKMVDSIRDVGARVLFCEKEIDEVAMEYLAKAGIFAVEKVDEDDIKLLCRALGAQTISNLSDIRSADLGECDTVYQKYVSGSYYVFIKGTKTKKAVTILLRGGTIHVVDEMERSLKDALKVVSLAVEENTLLPGGGALEVELSLRLRDYAGTVGGREQLAIESFANALQIIPKTIANNAGLNGLDLVMELTSRHKAGETNCGMDVERGEIQDSIEGGIVEPYKVKEQAIKSAVEAANMVLRIDDIIASRGGVGIADEE